MPISRLPREEIARRIKAARELRNISQIGLAALMEADGLNKHDLGQIEREKRTMQLVHQEALVRHLKVPERWFTSENVDEIVGYENVAGELASIRADLDELLGYRREAQEQLRNFDVEDAREFLNFLQEVRGRQGRDVSRRELQSRAATGR